MRVTLEITSAEWAWKVHDGKNVIATRTMRRDKAKSGFRSTEKAVVFENALKDYPGVLDAIEDESPMDICGALEYLEDIDD